MQRLLILPFLLLLLLLLSACTPSGKNTSNASVAITSHTNGTTITGSRDIIIVANLTNAVTDAVITAELNGEVVTATRNDDTVNIAVTVADNANTITITVANPGQTPPAGATVNLDYQPDPAASVTITSHVDGATITGSRTITVTADLTDAATDASITAEFNGTPLDPIRTADTVTVTASLADHANTITITATNPHQSAAPTSTSLNLNYPFITLSDGQAANIVIGQPDFTTTDEAARDKLFEGLYGRPAVANGTLYLPDYGADRVLGYHGVPTSNGAAADFVLGKTDFDDPRDPSSESVFSGPQTVITDGERLFVTDYSDDRILVYNSLPTTSGAAANHVIGQADFTSSDDGCSAIRFDSLESATVINGKLIVADTYNHRVLIWDSIPTSFDKPADLVLGQSHMDTCTSNDDSQTGISDVTPSSRTMYGPTDVWSDGTRLVVADEDNERVLIWSEFPTANFTPADLVLGQSDFTSRGWGAEANKLSGPYMLHSNGNQLFVADSDNNRVLIWNEFPTQNGQAADWVLGQTNMTDDSSNAGEANTNSIGFNSANGVYAHGNQLFVADNGNDRYLIFEGANP